ncbi:MAG: glycosyltransferase [Verrucomicrobiota bacterium]
MKASLIINNYNYAHYLNEAITSALQQDEAETELIIIDDASTDESLQVLEPWKSQARIIVHNTNLGQAAAFESGIRAAAGDIICFLDADDIWLSNKVKETIHLFQKYPSAAWSAHPLEFFNQESGATEGLDPPRMPSGYVDWRNHTYPWSKFPTLPATSGLSFRRKFLLSLLPMPQLRISGDNFLKCACVARAPGILSSIPGGRLRLHSGNAWTGRPKDTVDKSLDSIAVAVEVRKKLPSMRWWAWKHIAGSLTYIRRHESLSYWSAPGRLKQLPFLEQRWCQALALIHTLKHRLFSQS